MLARSLVAVSLAVAVVAPLPAQARFGKHSDSDKPSNPSSTPAPSSDDDDDDDQVHAATPVGSSPDRRYTPPPSCGGDCGSCAYSDCGYEDRGWAYYAYEYEPAYVGGAAAAAYAPDRRERQWNIRTALMGEAQGFTSGDGGLFSAGILIEGVRWGVDVDVRHIVVSTDDGTEGTDTLRLFNGAVTWTLFGNQTARIRLEGGFTAAFAPDVIVVSPQAGLSWAFGFGGAWGLEGLIRASLIPHTQVEWSAGFSYAMGPLGFRAGWRRIFLDDRGIVDGVAHQDVFAGPYLGMGLAF